MVDPGFRFDPSIASTIRIIRNFSARHSHTRRGDKSGDKSPARARPFERLDLRRAKPVQFSIDAGEARW